MLALLLFASIARAEGVTSDPELEAARQLVDGATTPAKIWGASGDADPWLVAAVLAEEGEARSLEQLIAAAPEPDGKLLEASLAGVEPQAAGPIARLLARRRQRPAGGETLSPTPGTLAHALYRLVLAEETPPGDPAKQAYERAASACESIGWTRGSRRALEGLREQFPADAVPTRVLERLMALSLS